jgi:hypothetical protein
LQQLQTQNQQLTQQVATQTEQITRLQGAIKYTVNSDLLFPSGSWDISPRGQKTMAKMAAQFGSLPAEPSFCERLYRQRPHRSGAQSEGCDHEQGHDPWVQIHPEIKNLGKGQMIKQDHQSTAVYLAPAPTISLLRSAAIASSLPHSA